MPRQADERTADPIGRPDGLQRLVDRQAAKRRIHAVLAAVESVDGTYHSAAAAGCADADESVPVTLSGQPPIPARLLLLRVADQG